MKPFDNLHRSDVTRPESLQRYAIATTTILSICFATKALAHGAWHTHIGTNLDTGASITYRSQDMTNKSQAYLIPGTLMGQEAHAYTSGVQVDQASLKGSYAWNSNWALNGGIETHQHNDELELEVENVSISFRPDTEENWYVSLGKMNSRMSPSANWHSNPHSLSDAWLQSDVHFGRHGTDTGIRASYEANNWQVGLEAWNGDRWPATPGEGHFALYGFSDIKRKTITLRTGIWASHAVADNRSDDRYEEGHSHGGEAIDTPSSEFRFDGDVDSYGLYIQTQTELSDTLTLVLDAEYVSQVQEGELIRDAQQAQISYEPESYRIHLGLRSGRHFFRMQWEKLIIENHISAGLDALFLSESNLENEGHEPQRMTAAWHWRYDSTLVTKLEWVEEDILDEDDKRSRVVISVSLDLDLIDNF